MRAKTLVLAFGALLLGCVYKGAKVTEGTDLAVGLDVPSTEGALQIQVLNYLTGFRMGIAENAIYRVDYTTMETNSWFGIIYSANCKTIHAEVEPCEVGSKEAAAE